MKRTGILRIISLMLVAVLVVTMSYGNAYAKSDEKEITENVDIDNYNDEYYSEPSFYLSEYQTVYLKHPQQLYYSMYPTKTIKWKSSNTKIATVSKKGVVTGKKTGTVTITAKANGITRKCQVTISKPYISLDYSDGVFFAGTKGTMSPSVSPYGAKVTWKSSNTKVAKVDKYGNITAIKPGTSTITATIAGAKATKEINVIANDFELNVSDKTVVEGDTFILKIPGYSGSISAYAQNGLVELNTDGSCCRVKAVSAGTDKITVTARINVGGASVFWSGSCDVEIQPVGISPLNCAVAIGATKSLSFKKSYELPEAVGIVWDSSNPAVATVDANGVVEGVAVGSTNITALVTFADGSSGMYSSEVKVSDPKLTRTKLTVALGGNIDIPVKGTNIYSDATWSSSKASVVWVDGGGSLSAVKAGTAVVTADIDGRILKCTVNVSNPNIKTTYYKLSPGKTAQIKVKGTKSTSKVSYKSSKTSVAKVSSSGKITAVKGGRAYITVVADGKEIEVMVEVANEKAVAATTLGHSIINVSEYSNALRMSDGYYDCSALVFKAYNRDAGLLGGSYAWAPTAANMASYMQQTGKVLSYSVMKVEELRPGDLVFYGGASNGRYLGIYHVSMYWGNNMMLEKPLRYYYTYDIVMIARPLP